MSGKRSKAARQALVEHDVHAMLSTFIANLRVIFKRRAKEQYRRFPKMKPPCHTCAFNPATDSWVGADATAWSLAQAIRDLKPFYCHDGMKIVDGNYDPRTLDHPMKMCAGYGVVLGDPDTITAFERAAISTAQAKLAQDRANTFACRDMPT